MKNIIIRNIVTAIRERLKYKRFKINQKIFRVVICVILSSIFIMQIVKLAEDKRLEEKEVRAIIIIFLGIVFFYYFYKEIIKRKKLKLQYTILEHQLEYYQTNIKEVEEYYQEARRLEHDFKKYLRIISSYLENDKINLASEYLRKIGIEKVDKLDQTIFCDNIMINYNINKMLKECNENNIQTYIKIITKLSEIKDMDIPILLSNLLDNAVETCKEIKNSKIVVEISLNNNIISICVKNTIINSVLRTNPNMYSTKQDKNIHGYGLLNVRNIVKKYSGKIEFFEDNEELCCDVLLFLNKI